MVLQREMNVPVWGQAAPGTKVTVTFRNQEKTATADADGKWTVRLDPMEAGGPDKLVVNGDSTTGSKQAGPVTFEDVLVGEVWVGSGQSNMAIGPGSFAKGDDVLAADMTNGPYSNLRIKTSGKWQVADSSTIPRFSALMFCFGLRLQRELGVPVGLMVGAKGGSPASRWLSAEALKTDAVWQERIDKSAAKFEGLQKEYEAETLPEWEQAAADAKQQGKPSPPRPEPPVNSKEKPGWYYSSAIKPLIPYGIRGVLWDQGESGTGVAGMGQYEVMGALIRGWRKDWGQDFPFIYVQKPSGGGCAWDVSNSVNAKAQPFAALPAKVPSGGKGAETYIMIMRYTNTAMVISSDLAPGTHPVNKSGYGQRAADVALGMVYGRAKEYYGPIYASHVIEGDKVRIRFTHVGQGLAFRPGDKPQGFALAGADGIYHWATAVIEGDAVVVATPNVPQPVSVRYAWAAQWNWANLFNKDGLPAVPFRTDRPSTL
jgi:sialate O-acetylesterase